jgi:hypothetical protein
MCNEAAVYPQSSTWEEVPYRVGPELKRGKQAPPMVRVGSADHERLFDIMPRGRMSADSEETSRLVKIEHSIAPEAMWPYGRVFGCRRRLAASAEAHIPDPANNAACSQSRCRSKWPLASRLRVVGLPRCLMFNPCQSRAQERSVVIAVVELALVRYA